MPHKALKSLLMFQEKLKSRIFDSVLALAEAMDGCAAFAGQDPLEVWGAELFVLPEKVYIGCTADPIGT